MPLTDEAPGRVKRAHERTVDVRRSVFEQFDPSLDYAQDRMHSMEILVDKLLQRSRALAPHFWTHTHRYVASDSVWCESDGQAVPEPASTTTEATFKEDSLRQEQVQAPAADNVLYPADVLRSCVCGWRNERGCYIPDNVCVRARAVLGQSEERTRNLFERLCAGQVYSPAADLPLVLHVLGQVDLAYTNCSARQPSIVWGLLAPAQQASWYAGETQAWTVDIQHLATTGPAGLRLDMLSPVGESLQNYTENFKLGESLRDTWNAQHKHTIAQPVCNSSHSEHLPDDLRRYFADVFVPMAHSVQIVPAVEFCGRWVLEGGHRGSEGVQREGCDALGWLALDANNKEKIGAGGGVEAIVQAMGGHRGSVLVQIQGCTALLILGRSNRDILQRIKSAGAEEAVQRAIASPDASESTKEQGQELLSLLRSV